MTQYQVLITEPAEIDIDRVYQHLLQQSPALAERFRVGLSKSIRSLSELPLRCTLAPESGRFDRPVRHLMYRQGRSIYRILLMIFEASEGEAPVVRVLRVLHGAQQRLGQEPQ